MSHASHIAPSPRCTLHVLIGNDAISPLAADCHCIAEITSRSRHCADAYEHRGNAGEEVVDDPTVNFANARRRSNSSGYSNNLINFKTKFDVNEPEPVFEETMGPDEEILEDLVKTETSETASSSSFDDDKPTKH
jgi:hypothetical protein